MPTRTDDDAGATGGAGPWVEMPRVELRELLGFWRTGDARSVAAGRISRRAR
jgi:hypothetical protein